MKSILETLFEHSWVGVLLLCLYLMMHELKLHPLLLWALILFLVVVSMWGMAVFVFPEESEKLCTLDDPSCMHKYLRALSTNEG
jgi:hypothetical protein